MIIEFLMVTPSARIIREAMERGWGMRGIEEVMNIAPIGGDVFIGQGTVRNTVTRIYLNVYEFHTFVVSRSASLKLMITLRYSGCDCSDDAFTLLRDENLRACD